MSLLKVNKPWFGNVPKVSFGSIANAQGGSAISSASNYVDVATAGDLGLLVDSIVINSNDSAAANVVVAIKRSSTYYPLGVVNVPINSGSTGAIVTTDVLDNSVIKGLPINTQGDYYLRLEPSDVLAFKVLVAVTNTAGIALRITVSGVEFESE